MTDLRSRRIPNALTGAALLAGLLLHAALLGRSAAFSAALAALLAGGLFFLVYSAGGMGAGDVKLMAALGAISGLHALPFVLLATAVSGGLLALLNAAGAGALRATVSNALTLLTHHARQGLTAHGCLHVRNEQRLRIPYAVPACIGCCYTLALSLEGGAR